MAEGNAALAQIVRRDLQRDSVAGDDPNSMFAHPSGGVRDEIVAVGEPYSIAGVGQDLGHDAIDFKNFLFGHDGASTGENKKPGRLPGPVPNDSMGWRQRHALV
jgi:hypothetical protein